MRTNNLAHGYGFGADRWSAAGRLVLALLVMLWSTACGQPTIDGTSMRRYIESKEEVRASLSAERRGEFDNAISLIEVSWAMGSLSSGLADLAQGAVDGLAGRPRQRTQPASPIETLHGRTARQVIAMADSIRAADGE